MVKSVDLHYQDLKNCGVMKFLADMPSCLEGEDNRINAA